MALGFGLTYASSCTGLFPIIACSDRWTSLTKVRSGGRYLIRNAERAVRRCTSRYDHVVISTTSTSSISLRKEQMDGEKNRGLGRTKTSEGVSHCLLGLRASTPVVEDDQDIGESNASVTINIGGAVVGHWFTVIARSTLSPSTTEFSTGCLTSR